MSTHWEFKAFLELLKNNPLNELFFYDVGQLPAYKETDTGLCEPH